jgi:hypothetical protein
LAQEPVLRLLFFEFVAQLPVLFQKCISLHQQLFFSNVFSCKTMKQESGLNRSFFRGIFSFSKIIPRPHLRSP